MSACPRRGHGVLPGEDRSGGFMSHTMSRHEGELHPSPGAGEGLGPTGAAQGLEVSWLVVPPLTNALAPAWPKTLE